METKPETAAAAESITSVPEVSEPHKAPATVAAVTPSAAGNETQTPTAASDAEKAAPIAEVVPIAELWKAAQETGHPDIWGVTLADPKSHIPSQIVLQKYLNANDGDLVKAKDQLVKTLEWRAQIKPVELVKKVFNKAKFNGLGFVTAHTADGATSTEPNGKEIFTWNIYGGVKSIEETFGNVQE